MPTQLIVLINIYETGDFLFSNGKVLAYFSRVMDESNIYFFIKSKSGVSKTHDIQFFFSVIIKFSVFALTYIHSATASFCLSF